MIVSHSSPFNGHHEPDPISGKTLWNDMFGSEVRTEVGE